MENIQLESKKKRQKFWKIYGKRAIQKQHTPYYRTKQAQNASAILSNPCITPSERTISSMKHSLHSFKRQNGNTNQLNVDNLINLSNKKIMEKYPQNITILNNLIKYSQYQKKNKSKKYFYLIEGSAASSLMNKEDFKDYLNCKLGCKNMENMDNQTSYTPFKNHDHDHQHLNLNTLYHITDNIENIKMPIATEQKKYKQKVDDSDKNSDNSQRYFQRRILFSQKNMQNLLKSSTSHKLNFLPQKNNNISNNQKQRVKNRNQSLTFNLKRNDKKTYQTNKTKKKRSSCDLHSWDVSQSLDITQLENKVKECRVNFQLNTKKVNS